MNRTQLKKHFGLEAIYGLDWETYWSDDFTLKKLTTTDYIMDPRFESQLIAVQKDTWGKAKVIEVGEFNNWAATVDWTNCGILAHHCQFDALIASHHHGVKASAYFDTLSMAKPVMPVTVGGSLNKIARAFGLPGKQYGDALANTKGLHWADMSKAQQKYLKTYAGDDIEQTWQMFDRLLEYTRLDELRLIDITMRMYAHPRVLLDKSMLTGVAADEAKRKAELLSRFNKKDLMSNDKFATLLEARGVNPPMKISPTTNKLTYAFSKQDQEFKDLLEHDDEDIRALVEARFGVKSTSVESRAERLAARADYGPQPVYLNYWGAGTGRWSGGDKVNWQNMKRGSDIRKAIMAPKGYSFVIADLSQIEARVNAWFSKQSDMLEAFASGKDVYKIAASSIYNLPPDEINSSQRFIGKCCVLALGYGAGWVRFGGMLRLGALGPAVKIGDNEAQLIHAAWRRNNPFIVANWRATHGKIKSAILAKTTVEDGCVSYEYAGGNLFMHMPNGTALRYDRVEFDDEGLNYVRRVRSGTEVRSRLYGGLEVENRTQALARIVIGDHMLAIEDAVADWQQVLTTHDEIVGLVPTARAKQALRTIKEIMTTPPVWAPDLPLGVDAHVSRRYDK